MYSQKAQHILIDVRFDRYPSEFEDVEFWKEFGKAALEKGSFTLLKEHFHSFEPKGVSGFWLLSESHLSVHTWPEVGHVFVDLFSCGNRKNSKKTVSHLIDGFELKRGKVFVCKEIERGFVYSSKEKKGDERDKRD